MTKLIFLLFLFTASFVVAQSGLDKKITEFANKNNLYNKKFEKLEAIYRNPNLSEEKRRKKWDKAYQKWDAKGITDSLNAERELVNYLGGLRYRYRGKIGGYNLDYLLFRLSEMTKHSKLSLKNSTLLEQILIKQWKHKEEVDADIKALSNSIADFFKTNPEYDQLSRFIQNDILDSTTIDFENFINKYFELSESKRNQFTNYLIELGIDHWDLIMIDEIASFQTQTVVGDEFKTKLTRDFSFVENDNLKYADFGNVPEIKRYSQLKLFLWSFLKFEKDVLNGSSLGNAIKRKGWIDAFDYLYLFEYNFNKYTIPGNSELSHIQQLLVAAYNDVYFYFNQDKLSISDWNSRRVDLSKVNLSTNQQAVIDAILSTSDLTTKSGLKKHLSNDVFQKIEWDLDFKLACYFALYQKAMTVDSEWNRDEYIIDPFESSEVDADIEIIPFSDNYWNDLRNRCRESLETAGYGETKFIITYDGNGKIICSPEVLRNKGVNSVIQTAINKNTTVQYLRLIVETGKIERKVEKPQNGAFEYPVRSSPDISDYHNAVPPPMPPPNPRTPTRPAEIVDFPDVEASFPGGAEAMKQWILDHMEYPEISRELGDQGRVYVTFIVERDGSITGVDVMRGGISPELNKEAKRLMRTMPKWEPGLVKGKPVRARCRVPIPFMLN